MSKTERKAPGRFAAVTGALCRVFGVFKRGRRAKRPPRLPGETGIAKQRLEIEIGRLEQELDQVYSRVVHQAGHSAGDWAAADLPDLSTAIERARELKAILRAKRSELARRNREVARQSRLVKSTRAEAALVGRYDQAPPEGKAGTAINGREEPNPKMRRAVIKIAKRFTFVESSEQMLFDAAIDDLLDPDPEIRRTALTRLSELDTPGTSAILAAALDDNDDRVRIAALNNLALIGDASAGELFRRAATSANHFFRLAALRGLANIGDERDDPILFSGLEDEHQAVRRAAATYLGWRRTSTATKPLLRALRDDDEEVRASAAISLGNIRDDRAALSLIRTLEDRSPKVRRAAIAALEDLLQQALGLDADADADYLRAQVNQLKTWWRRGRIDRRFASLDLPEAQPPMAAPAPPAAEPAAAQPEAPSPPPSEEPAEPAVAAEPAEAEPEIAVGPTPEAAAAPAEEPSPVDGIVGLEDLSVMAAEPAAEPAAAEPTAEPAAAEPAGLDIGAIGPDVPGAGIADLDGLGSLGVVQPDATESGLEGGDEAWTIGDMGGEATEGLDSDMGQFGLDGLDLKTTEKDNESGQKDKAAEAANEANATKTEKTGADAPKDGESAAESE